MSEKKERGFLDQVGKAFDTSGNLVQESLIQSIEGLAGVKTNPEDIVGTITGEKDIYGDEFFERFTEATGIPSDSGFDTLNAIRNFVFEVATDPLTYAGGLLQIGKLGKAIQSIKNPLVRKSAERAIIGGAYGALSLDKDSDISDFVTKPLTGAAIGTVGGAGFEKAAGIAKGAASKSFDKAAREKYKGIFNKIQGAFPGEMELTEAAAMAKKASERAALKESLYHEEIGGVLNKLTQDMANKGSSPEEIFDAVNDFQRMLGDGYSSSIAIREASGKVFDDILAPKRKDHRSALGLFNELAPVVGEKEAQALTESFIDTTKKKVIERRMQGIPSEAVTGSGSGKELVTGSGAPMRGMFRQNVTTEFADNIMTAATLNKASIPGKHGKEIREAIKGHIDANRRLIDDFNKSNYGDSINVGIVPFSLHTVDLKNIDNALDDKLLGASRGGVQRRVKDEVSVELGDLTRDDMLKIGARRFARMYMEDTELRAKAIVDNISRKKSNATGFLKGYDDLTTLAKTGYLTASLSWIKNNYATNVINAYIAGGVKHGTGQMVKGLGAGALTAADSFNLKILNDLARKSGSKQQKILDAVKNGNAYKIDDDMIRVGTDLGFIDADRITDISDMSKGKLVGKVGEGKKLFKQFYKESPEGMADNIRNKTINAANKTHEWLWNKVGRVGSTIESSFKIGTFEDVLKSSIKTKYRTGKKAFDKYKLHDVLRKDILSFPKADRKSVSALKAAVKDSKSKVDSIYFDYNDITPFEQERMKRILPFWTFNSKNMGLWVDKVTRDPRAVSVASAATDSLGRETNLLERLALPDYIKEQNVRIQDKEDGSIETKTFPSAAHLEAYKNLTSPLRSVGNQLNPLIKAPLEAITNVNMFTGQPVRPRREGDEVRVQEGAVGLLPDPMLEKLKLTRDKNGKLVTDSAAAASIAKLVNEAIPAPILPQIARSMRDVKYKGTTPIDELANIISPIRSSKMTKEEVAEKAVKNVKRELNKAKRKQRRDTERELIKILRGE
jgi:hypothetical protein